MHELTVIKIPKNLVDGSIGEVIRQGLSHQAFIANNMTVSFDFNQVQYVDPAGCVGLGSLITYLAQNGIKSKILFAEYSRVIKYLDDAEFFKAIIGSRLHGNSSTRSTTIPYFSFSDDTYNGYLFQKLTPWIATEVNLSVQTIETIRAAFEELFHNVTYHSGVNAGCTLSQHLPNKKRINFAISDFGVGIPTLVRTKENLPLDSDCIRRACDEGFTTKSNVKNRGAGLHVLIQQVVMRNNGYVLIKSGSGELRASRQGGKIRYNKLESELSYPGTLVQATLRTDTLESMDEDTQPEEFSW